MRYLAFCIAVCLLGPGVASACTANWRIAQTALGAADLRLSDAPPNAAAAGGTACRVREPTLGIRGDTRMQARAVTWRTAPRKPVGASLLFELQIVGFTLVAGRDDTMAAYIAEVMSLDRPTDLTVTLTWSEPTNRLELRSRGGSVRPSIWFDTQLSDVAPPGDVWWAGFETATLRDVDARLRADGGLERAVLALKALDRLRGNGAPAPRLEALRNVVAADIARLPTDIVDPVSRSTLATALADVPGGRGTLELSANWLQSIGVPAGVAGFLAGRFPPPARIDIGYSR